jgi:hypothetical protein
MHMYVTIEMNIMNSAIERSWGASFDKKLVCTPASAATALAAVEDSAFVIGSSSMRALQTRCLMVAVWFMNKYVTSPYNMHPSYWDLSLNFSYLIRSAAVAIEAVTRRISTTISDGSTAMLLLAQFASDTWALEQRICEMCLQMYSPTERVQVMAAADQVDEQLRACAAAFQLRLLDECR